jgi:branched-chain amino acid transport system ATP-binding protein
MSAPCLLMLDEPSRGSRRTAETMTGLDRLRREGLTILLVEQSARAALALADRGHVLDTGTVVARVCGAEVLDDPEVGRAYLGRSPDHASGGGVSA